MGIVPDTMARPHARNVQLERPHLRAIVDASRVTAVYALAGCGKTVVVLQCAQALAAEADGAAGGSVPRSA